MQQGTGATAKLSVVWGVLTPQMLHHLRSTSLPWQTTSSTRGWLTSLCTYSGFSESVINTQHSPRSTADVHSIWYNIQTEISALQLRNINSFTVRMRSKHLIQLHPCSLSDTTSSRLLWRGVFPRFPFPCLYRERNCLRTGIYISFLIFKEPQPSFCKRFETICKAALQNTC